MNIGVMYITELTGQLTNMYIFLITFFWYRIREKGMLFQVFKLFDNFFLRTKNWTVHHGVTMA